MQSNLDANFLGEIVTSQAVFDQLEIFYKGKILQNLENIPSNNKSGRATI